MGNVMPCFVLKCENLFPIEIGPNKLFIPISIGNKERKHTCHNKPEKTMDSR